MQQKTNKNMQNGEITEKITWFYGGKSYPTRRAITDKFGWSTHKWNAKLEEGKIKKLITKLKTEDNSYENIHKNAKQHNESTEQ